jgi:hypothetical protein
MALLTIRNIVTRKLRLNIADIYNKRVTIINAVTNQLVHSRPLTYWVYIAMNGVRYSHYDFNSKQHVIHYTQKDIAWRY